MKIHPRTLIVDKARLAFDQFLLDLEQKHNLTYGEIFSLLGGAVVSLAKYQIRAERHPEEPGKKGDEA